ncbi:helix-hairpin-helix domain-containing protein [Halovenus salina]|uniref:Helix-hairpin-helix domain-containing protein n=1 Tax=Halovenus salina TaxID=1510225 RepID=A0ABD5W9H2_9EURY|nr:helix-hairpin-helix domain-containing protein [Halovenus salina]
MSAKSLIQKIKQFVGLSDGSGSSAGPSAPEETDVTIEREPETTTADKPTATAEEDEAISTDTEPVETIKGIGPTYSDRLESNGLGTVAALADSDAETVAEAAQTSEGRASEWVKRARNR